METCINCKHFNQKTQVSPIADNMSKMVFKMVLPADYPVDKSSKEIVSICNNDKTNNDRSVIQYGDLFAPLYKAGEKLYSKAEKPIVMQSSSCPNFEPIKVSTKSKK